MIFFKYVVFLALFFPIIVSASEGYKITGKSGIMYFASIENSQKNNEDIFRIAASSACAGKSICQVQYWVGSSPKSFPLTEQQANTKIAHWQQNLNTGLRRWLVKCDSTKLFSNERQCM